MMLTLSLLRHAKSSWEIAGCPDHDRPLKGRGFKDAAIMGAELYKRNVLPEKVFSSTSKRTRQTVDEVAGVWKKHGFSCELAFEASIYCADLNDLFEFVKAIEGVRHAMLVGHNPGMHELVSLLAGRYFEKFQTAACAYLEFDCRSWAEIAKGQGRLIEYIYPKLFKHNESND